MNAERRRPLYRPFSEPATDTPVPVDGRPGCSPWSGPRSWSRPSTTTSPRLRWRRVVAAGWGRVPSRSRTPDPRAEHGVVCATFAEKLDHLFRTVHPAGRGPYSLQEASEAIGAGAGEGRAGLSASAIQKLRIGGKTNPTMRTLESLARFFGVAPAYFFDDAPPPAGPADPGLLAAVDVPGVRELALDAAALSQESRAVVHAMAVRLRELEAGAVRPRRGARRSR